MELRQEIEVWYVIPTIRKELSVAMKNNGTKQTEIAKRLGISKAAVTQYISNKRASGIKLNDAMLSEVKQSASIINDEMDSMREIQRLIHKVYETRMICEIHKSISKDKGKFKNCEVCFTK